MISNSGNGEAAMMDHDVHGNRIHDPVTKRDLRGSDYANDYSSVLSSVSNAVEPEILVTEEMIAAGLALDSAIDAVIDKGRIDPSEYFPAIYRAMAALAPTIDPSGMRYVPAVERDAYASRVASLEAVVAGLVAEVRAKSERIEALEAEKIAYHAAWHRHAQFIRVDRDNALRALAAFTDPPSRQGSSDLPDPPRRPDGTLAPQPKPWTPPKANGDARRIGG